MIQIRKQTLTTFLYLS